MASRVRVHLKSPLDPPDVFVDGVAWRFIGAGITRWVYVNPDKTLVVKIPMRERNNSAQIHEIATLKKIANKRSKMHRDLGDKVARLVSWGYYQGSPFPSYDSEAREWGTGRGRAPRMIYLIQEYVAGTPVSSGDEDFLDVLDIAEHHNLFDIHEGNVVRCKKSDRVLMIDLGCGARSVTEARALKFGVQVH